MIALRDSVRLTRRPIVTVSLIAANLVAYLLSIRGGGSIVDGPTSTTIVAYGAIPYEFAHLGSHCALAAAGFSQTVLCTGRPGVIGTVAAQPPTWQTAFTSMFTHANVLALAVDMFFLGVAGATLEDTLGRLRFLAFYLLGGLAALAMSITVSPDSLTPALGASGAVGGVLGGYVLLHPRARVLIAVVPGHRFAEPQAWAFVGLWVALDVSLGALHVITPFGGAGAAYYAQLGGIAFGLLAVRAFAHSHTPPYTPPRTA